MYASGRNVRRFISEAELLRPIIFLNPPQKYSAQLIVVRVYDQSPSPREFRSITVENYLQNAPIAIYENAQGFAVPYTISPGTYRSFNVHPTKSISLIQVGTTLDSGTGVQVDCADERITPSNGSLS